MFKKFIRFGAVIAILVSVVATTTVARADRAAAINTTGATSPWYTGYVDKTTSTYVGAYSSVAYNPDDGLPYMSYYDATNGNLKLSSPVTTGGNCGDNNMWWCRVVDGINIAGITGETNGDVGSYSSIAFWKGIVGIIPVWKLGISYHDSTNNALKVAIWSQSLFSSGWTISTIDSGSGSEEVGTHTSIKFDSNGTPWVAYYQHVYITLFSSWFGDLMLATPVTGSSGNCGPSGNTWQCDIIDNGLSAGVGQYASLGLGYNDVPYIAYYDVVNTNLKYAHFAGATFGNCGPSNSYDCIAVTGSGFDAGISAALTAPRSSTDIPRIAYYDKTNGKLRYATPTASGSGGNCLSTAWQCYAVDTIGVITIQHVGISMTLDVNGYPIIAYESATDDLGPSTLKIAQSNSAIGELIGNCGDIPSGLLFQLWTCKTIDHAGNPSIINEAAYTSVAVSPSGLATIAYFETDDYTPRTNLKVAYQRFQVSLPLIER